MGKNLQKVMYLAKVEALRRETNNDTIFLSMAIRLYRGLASAASTTKGKLSILKQKIVSIMLANELVKFVSARTEAKLIYEIKLPDDDEGLRLRGELLCLMRAHGVLEGLSEEDVQHLVIPRAPVITRKYEPTDKCKKLLRSNPELWEEVRKLLKIKPKLEVGVVTKKTREGK